METDGCKIRKQVQKLGKKCHIGKQFKTLLRINITFIKVCRLLTQVNKGLETA
jgi:hypothetical protein